MGGGDCVGEGLGEILDNRRIRLLKPSKLKYGTPIWGQMLLSSVPEETYCPKTETHAPWRDGPNIICYRCGFLIGKADGGELGTLLDY